MIYLEFCAVENHELPSVIVRPVSRLFVAANLVATYKYHLFTKRHLLYISDGSWWYTQNQPVKRVA